MPSWRDRLRPASFGGVLFHVRESELSGGRRAAVHEYPLRDRPFVEDLGREARRITVEGYLVGDDFATRREELAGRFEASPPRSGKPGRILVLPTLGAIKVHCASFRFRDSTEEGRMARFSAEFVEVGEDLFPARGTNPAGAADGAAEAATAAASSEASAGMTTAGVVEEARAGVADVAVELTRRLRRLDVFSGPARDVAALEDALTQLAQQAELLAASPANFAARVLETLDEVLAAASTPLGALEAYRALFEFPPFDPQGSGLQAETAAENRRLAVELVRVGAVAGAARAAARASFETLEDAQAVRDELSGEIDSLAGEVGDELGGELEDLRAVIGRTVPPPAQDLPSLRTVTLAATLPALVVAFSLYQDEGRDEEIVRRNAVRHPLRVPGAVPLLVLSR